MSEFALEMRNIRKVFPGVVALDNVTFETKIGEVHALVGENGAGKSTLMKILDGVYQADEGEIKVSGEKVTLKDTNDAKAHGISLIFQEFNLVPSLSVAENMFLGKCKDKWINWKRFNDMAKKMLVELDFDINAKTLVDDLGVAEKQMVEIAKALAIDAKIIVMDEPTATLTERETEKLFKIIRNLKKNGITVIFISHKLDEIFEITDTVTVLRDGQVIDTMQTAKTNKNEIIEKMVGRPVSIEFPKTVISKGEVILEAKDVFREGILKKISFNLHKGEILGLAGLVGSGRTELVRLIFGADKMDGGKIKIKGKSVKILSTVDGKNNSIGLVPEDRKEQGLALDFSVERNLTICDLRKICIGNFIISKKKESRASKEYIKKLNIKTPSPNQKVLNLSGGNQQKIVFAKWHYFDADVIILDEPTRGIDVGAKYEIYLLMNEMVKQGKSVIMISSELPEVLGMSDRILVMHNGEAKAILDRKVDDIRAENIMRVAIN